MDFHNEYCQSDNKTVSVIVTIAFTCFLLYDHLRIFGDDELDSLDLFLIIFIIKSLFVHSNGLDSVLI